MIRLLLFCLLAFSLQACQQTKHLKVGTGSRIDVLNWKHQFSSHHLPNGWIISGMDPEDLFETRGKLPNIYMIRKNGHPGVHLQSTKEDFILARHTNARLLVSPFLLWRWYLSEHRTEDHPVSMIVGFYGGAPESEPISQQNRIWKGEELPPFDRVISIGFNELALRRGNMFSKGQMKYYVQRGGVEQTNKWHDEAADLSQIYKWAWPEDDQKNVHVTFVGMTARAGPEDLSAGATFSNIWLSR